MHRGNYRMAIASAMALWVTSIGMVAKAMQYGHAARRDERNGFLYSAALEWRHAAEVFGSNNVASDYYWSQWERVMHLPRRLAQPIDDSQPTVNAATSLVLPSVLHQISSAHAA